MWGSPYYPAGVTDAMIDKYFGDDGSCCEKCRYYLSGTCTKKEDEYSAKELEDMTDEEYESFAPWSPEAKAFCSSSH